MMDKKIFTYDRGENVPITGVQAYRYLSEQSLPVVGKPNVDSLSYRYGDFDASFTDKEVLITNRTTGESFSTPYEKDDVFITLLDIRFIQTSNMLIQVPKDTIVLERK